MQRAWQRGLNSLFGLLPNRCIACRQSVAKGEQGICQVCLQAGLYQQVVCLGCSKPIAEPGEEQIRPYCGTCQNLEPIKIISPCRYHDGLGRWVAAMKYQREFAVLEALCTALHHRVEALRLQHWYQLPQAIVPVPLHRNRLTSRGFNQAWLIADNISKLSTLPLIDDQLIRIKDTPAQAGLDGKQRRSNIEQAFELKANFPYQRIALIDDVVTTGTTINEIAQCFQQQYVDVQVWCLASAEAPSIET